MGHPLAASLSGLRLCVKTRPTDPATTLLSTTLTFEARSPLWRKFGDGRTLPQRELGKNSMRRCRGGRFIAKAQRRQDAREVEPSFRYSSSAQTLVFFLQKGKPRRLFRPVGALDISLRVLPRATPLADSGLALGYIIAAPLALDRMNHSTIFSQEERRKQSAGWLDGSPIGSIFVRLASLRLGVFALKPDRPIPRQRFCQPP
jgi:hypothetical protein